MKKAAWGGKREGAGRPVSETKRKRRALCFLDSEWQMIRRKAEEKNLSPREYLFLLVEKYNFEPLENPSSDTMNRIGADPPEGLGQGKEGVFL